MTRRERLRRCYCHEELDRPAVYSRTGFPAGDPTYDRLKDYLAAHTELKRGWSAGGLIEAPPSEEHVEPESEDWERHVTILRTPAGELRSSRRVSLKGQPGMVDQHLLEGREDARKYLSLPEPEIGGDVSGFFDARSEVGEAGIAEAGLGFNPAGFVAELFGSTNFALMCATDRDMLHALCRRRMETTLRLVRYLLERDVGPFFSMLGEEYLTPPLHGPRDFDEFNVRYDRPILDLIHEAGGRVHIHCHGRIKKVFGGFVEMRADVLHPFEAPPMGDITPAEAKEMGRGRICLEGNIQISDMYESTPEEIREQTSRLIEEAFDDRRGLIVCPTASPYIRGAGEQCFPQYKAMIDTVLEAG
jgi:hypothetical protein